MRRWLIPSVFAAGLLFAAGLVSAQNPPVSLPNGIVKYVPGTGYTSAVAGTDYVAPSGSGAALTGITASQIGSVPAGVLKGSGGAFAAAAAGTDYLTPSGNGSGLTSLTPANISAGTAGINVTGNAGTVTNGVYTTGSYSDPAWITGLAGSKVSGAISGAAGSLSTTVASGKLWGGQGTGVPSAVTVGSGLTLSAGTLTASGGGSPAKTYYLSTNGCVGDVDLATGLKIGGGSATDNAAAINAVLASATATNPVRVIVDGAYAIGSPILVPNGGHVTIEGGGWDTGFYCLPGTNGPALTNLNLAAAPYNPFDPGPSPPAIGTAGRLVVRNLQIQHNRGTYPSGNSSTGAGKDARGFSAGPWYCAIDVATLTGFVADGIFIKDSCAYNIRLNNVTDAVVARSRFENNVGNTNTDGVHVNGACWNVRIVTNVFKNIGDDAIALNMPEGYSTAGGRIIIANNIVDDCKNAVRVYAATTPDLSNVVITGNIFEYQQNAIYLSSGSPAASDHMRAVRFADCVFRQTANNAQPLAFLQGTANLIEFDNCTWQEPQNTSPWIGSDYAVVVNTLRLRNCTILRNGNASGAAPVVSIGNATIGLLDLDGVSYVNSGSVSDVAAVVSCTGGTIQTLRMSGHYPAVNKLISLSSSAGACDATVGPVYHQSGAASQVPFSSTAGLLTVNLSAYKGSGVSSLASGSVLVTGPGVLTSGIALADANAGYGVAFKASDHSNSLTVNKDGFFYPLTIGSALDPSNGPHAKYAGLFNNSGNGNPFRVAAAANQAITTGGWWIGQWCKTTSNLQQAGITKWNQGTSAQQEWYLGLDQGSQKWSFFWSTTSGSVSSIGSTANATGNVWVCLQVWYDTGDGKVHLSVNDVEQGTGVASATFMATSACDLEVGGAVNNLSWGFSGPISTTWKSHATPSSGDRTWAYNAGAGRSSPEFVYRVGANLDLVYDFFDGTNPPNTLGYDRSSNAYHLTPRYASGPTQTLGPG